MKKYIVPIVLCVSIFLGFNNITAAPLTSNEYIVNVTTQNLGLNSWKFIYEITNVNQQAPNDLLTGLDGFAINIPSTAIISNVTVPTSYLPGGWWSYGIENDTFLWTWGNDPRSVYPMNSKATFSFQADNIMVGSQDSELTTYWNRYIPSYEYWSTDYGTHYTTFETALTGPVSAVPEPATMLLLGLGLVGLAGIRRKP